MYGPVKTALIGAVREPLRVAPVFLDERAVMPFHFAFDDRLAVKTVAQRSGPCRLLSKPASFIAMYWTMSPR